MQIPVLYERGSFPHRPREEDWSYLIMKRVLEIFRGKKSLIHKHVGRLTFPGCDASKRLRLIECMAPSFKTCLIISINKIDNDEGRGEIW